MDITKHFYGSCYHNIIHNVDEHDVLTLFDQSNCYFFRLVVYIAIPIILYVMYKMWMEQRKFRIPVQETGRDPKRERAVFN